MTDGDAPLSPATQLSLIGHDAAENLFLEAFNAGRLHHAWLIAGPRGIGKATLAYRIARFMLSRDTSQEPAGPGLFGDEPAFPATIDVSADDPVSRRIAAGAEPDLTVLSLSEDPKTGRMRSEISVHEARLAGQFLRRTSSAGGWRVVIVDAVDDLNRNAANAILKILEEPPRNVLFLLVNHAPGKTLPTIRSRCRTLTLHPLSAADVDRVLDRVRPDIPVAERQSLLALSGGSAGRALTLADAGAVDVLNVFLDLVSTLPQIDRERMHRFAEALGKGGAADQERFDAAREVILWWLGGLARAAATVGRGWENAIPDTLDPRDAAVRRRLAPAGLDRWAALWEKVAHRFDRTNALNLDRRLILLETLGEIHTLSRQ